jgi:hypothetical protein
MSFKLETLYFDSVPALHLALQEHTVARISKWCGAYATVYDLGDRVLKVSGGDDLGYLAYLHTMSTLSVSNRYLPRIHSAVHLRLTDEARKENGLWLHRERIVTYMEKLDQPPKLLRRINSARGDLLATSYPPVKKWVMKVEKYLLTRGTEHLSKLRLEHQELIVLLKIALQYHMDVNSEHTPRSDLHAGNALCRGKTFVVTDPFV